MARTAITAVTTLLLEDVTPADLEHLEVNSLQFRGTAPIFTDLPGEVTGDVITGAPVLDTAALIAALTTVVDTVDAEEGRYAAGLHSDHVNGFSFVLEDGAEREYTDADLTADIAAHDARVTLLRSLIANLTVASA